MRDRRSRLDSAVLAAVSTAVTVNLLALPVLRTARRIAAYSCVRGEISLDGLLDGPHGDRYTLPRVRGRDLEFVARHRGQRFTPGSFAIPEPVDGEIVALADHDVVLAPLVAFDASGVRLGQGKGFYDRALAPLAATRRMVLIGIAHSFQQVDELPRQPWDVPLDGIMTEAGLVEVTGRVRETGPQP